MSHLTTYGFRQRSFGFFPVFSYFRPIGDHDHAGTHWLHTTFVQIIDRGPQHFGAMLARAIGLRADTEQGADITKTGRGKQCVNQRMSGDIAIRIALDAIALPTQTGKP